MDIDVKDKFMAAADVELSGIQAGDFIYCVAVPINIKSENARGRKYTTVPVLSAEEMPERPDEAELYYEIDPEDAGIAEPRAGEAADLPSIDEVDFDALGDGWIQVKP